jgi:hypothetical protein
MSYWCEGAAEDGHKPCPNKATIFASVYYSFRWAQPFDQHGYIALCDNCINGLYYDQEVGNLVFEEISENDYTVSLIMTS